MQQGNATLLLAPVPAPTAAAELPVQMALQSRVLEIKVLDYRGQEHAIQVSVDREKPVIEGFQQVTIIEDINALICGYLSNHGKGLVLGYQSTMYSQSPDGYAKSIEWTAKKMQ